MVQEKTPCTFKLRGDVNFTLTLIVQRKLLKKGFPHLLHSFHELSCQSICKRCCSCSLVWGKACCSLSAGCSVQHHTLQLENFKGTLDVFSRNTLFTTLTFSTLSVLKKEIPLFFRETLIIFLNDLGNNVAKTGKEIDRLRLFSSLIFR